MQGSTLLALAVLVLIVLAVIVVWYMTRQRRSQELRQHFGPEYQRTVQSTGDPGRAERELEARRERVEALHIHDLDPAEREQYAGEWRTVQARFVDDPAGAVAGADTLIQRVMQERGYPVGEFEQRAADISVDHPAVVEHYRAAHDVAQRQAAGSATTEDLRRAMVDYRALFADLLGETPANAPATQTQQGQPATGQRLRPGEQPR